SRSLRAAVTIFVSTFRECSKRGTSPRNHKDDFYPSSLILSKPRVGFTALSLPRSPPCRRALAPVELSRAFVPLNGAQEEIAFPAAGNGGSSSVVGFRRTALTLPLPSSSNNRQPATGPPRSIL